MVQEFKIENNTYDAAFGLASGTTMNLITESGSNALHGSAWEYLRNGQTLDARNFFAVNNIDPTTGQEIPGSAVPKYIRNQFGFALGGPIRKNKTFFFGSYEGLRLIQGESNGSVVPTAAERAGDFSSFLTGQTANLCASSGSAAPASLNFDTGQLFAPGSESLFTCPADPANPSAGTSTVLVGTPISGNVITNMDPVAQKVLALYPAPNRAGIPNYVNETPLRRPDDQFDTRIDEVLSDKDRLFGRYLYGRSNQLFPGNFDPFNGLQLYLGQNVVGGWTRVFSPTLINDVRIGYQRDLLDLDCSGCPRQSGLLASFGIQNLQASTPQLESYPQFQFTNFARVGDGSYDPDILPDRILKFEDTVTKILGRHTFVAGGDFNFWSTPGVEDPVQVNGFANFNGQFSSLAGEIPNVSSVADLADLELGFPALGYYTRSPIVNNLKGGGWFSLFAQDHIKVNSRLSVEIGLRWEYRKQPYDQNNDIAALYPLADNETPGDALLLTALPDAANDALCSNSYFINANGECLVMSSAMRKQLGFTGNKIREVSTGPGHGNFNPRLGISWRPINSDKFVFHAGGGVFNDLPYGNIQGSFVNNNPVFTQTPTYNTAFGAPPPLTNGVPTTTELMFASSANAANVPLSQITGEFMPSPIYATPTVYEWSASIQSQFAHNWALEVGYIGNRGVHLDYCHSYGNQAVPGVGDLQPRRIWPDFNSVLYDSFDSISNYEALTAKVTRRFCTVSKL